ncbi:MAG: tRNA (cytidine(34)-2'-O)-methyltransferase [Thermosynechococcaceae cyanobacterium]
MLKLVLVHPQIPPNTGNIARTCAATETELHLVEPLGFDLSDRQLKRAGLDYWPAVKLYRHPSWDAFYEHATATDGRLMGFSTSGDHSYWHVQFQPNDWLLFGSETQGLSPSMLQSCNATVRIPMSRQHVRSLNLSVSAALGLFEARRQMGLES